MKNSESFSLTTSRFRITRRTRVIHCEGETPTNLMCLLSGKVKIYKDGVGGRSQIIRMIKPDRILRIPSLLRKSGLCNSGLCIRAVSLVCLIPMTAVDDSAARKTTTWRCSSSEQLSVDLGIADERTVNLTQKHIRGRLAESLHIPQRKLWFGGRRLHLEYLSLA